ncbi:MAG: DNA primase [Planctomycetota bacterium]
MTSDHEFRRALDEIKLRAPIEEIVAESVELKPRGNLLWACCPFHEERTPSFKIDPREGTWYCFGACRKGGDVISYVQERGNMTFMDALELLAARTGVELPRRRRERRGDDPAVAALRFAEEYFRRELGGSEGRDARRYLTSRGFGESAIEAFGLGWAPRSGRRFLAAAKSEGIEPGALIGAGLARRDEGRGELYAFFRGRCTIPIRDQRGTTVGFGARLVGDEDGPKYINTSDTPLFHKGRVIYGLDRATEAVRRDGHLVLVEGYTDVIAAHAAGMPNVAAVLGTATTGDHAALIRRLGTRRVSLVFDGDEAGRRAAWRGLEGLLPLDLRLEVVPLPEGCDPADILLGEAGARGFAARLETGVEWLTFVADSVGERRAEGGRAFAQEVDRALELFTRLSRPVEVDAAACELADRLSLPRDTIREQLGSLRQRRRGRGARTESRPAPQGDGKSPGEDATNRGPAPLDPVAIRAYAELAGAAIVDGGLIPRLRPWVERCGDRDLGHLFQTLVDLWENVTTEITVPLVLGTLGNHPVRNRVAGMIEHARRAEHPARLFEGAVQFLEQHEQQAEIQRLQAEIEALERRAEDDPSVADDLGRALGRLLELRRRCTSPA